jgi:hypothetical protein
MYRIDKLSVFFVHFLAGMLKKRESYKIVNLIKYKVNSFSILHTIKLVSTSNLIFKQAHQFKYIFSACYLLWHVFDQCTPLTKETE